MFMMFLFLCIKFPGVGFLSQRACIVLILRNTVFPKSANNILFSQRVQKSVTLLFTLNPCWQWVSSSFFVIFINLMSITPQCYFNFY